MSWLRIGSPGVSLFGVRLLVLIVTGICLCCRVQISAAFLSEGHRLDDGSALHRCASSGRSTALGRNIPLAVPVYPSRRLRKPLLAAVGHERSPDRTVLRGMSPRDAGIQSTHDSGTSTVASCAALIAGTTIGGGFLALPMITQPLGLVPAFAGILTCWLFLMASSFSLIEAVFLTKAKASVDPDLSISIFSLARNSLGDFGSLFSSVTFLALLLASLIAQLSKVSSVISSPLPSSWVTILFGLSVSMLTFARNGQYAEQANSFLTMTMLTSFAATALSALTRRDWGHASLLTKADWTSFYPSRGIWAVPVLLQLLVYSETLPMICDRLKEPSKARAAVLYGSAVPMLMCVIWSFVALGFAPVVTSVGNALVDPVEVLLQSSSRWLSTSIRVLSLSAIATTIIGSLLALTQFFDDLTLSRNMVPGKLPKVLNKFISIMPATLIAAFGSKSLYLSCTQFAGAFPVTALWCLLPSLVCLRLGSPHRVKHAFMIAVSTVVMSVSAVFGIS
jgi:tyrosine-specific transport protein